MRLPSFCLAGLLAVCAFAPPAFAADAVMEEPPAPAPEGWLRPGWAVGLPIVWAAVCLVAIPLAVYVVSYIPWADIGNNQLWPGFPAGNTGQTLLELTGQMYNYHNSLADAHPASSPWWSWPFDLKPVWFYQDSFAGGTSAAVYDAGNLVIWWMGVPAMLFAALMAYRRRSLALGLIAIGFAAQWVPWARIDRAAFQYHYYTALPFMIMALAYFVAELWHGPSRRTWLLARIAGAAAIVAPAAMWLLSRPLCAFVGVESVNPGSAACPAVIPDLVITARSLGLLVVVAIGAVWLGRAVLSLGAGDGSGPGSFARVMVPAVGVAIGFLAVALIPDAEVTRLTGLPVEPIALVVGLPLLYVAAQAPAARDAIEAPPGPDVVACGVCRAAQHAECRAAHGVCAACGFGPGAAPPWRTRCRRPRSTPWSSTRRPMRGRSATWPRAARGSGSTWSGAMRGPR